MKRRRLALFLALAILLSWLPLHAQATRRVRVGFFELSNYFTLSESGEMGGYGYEYQRELAQLAGWEFEYIYASRQECIEMLAAGEIDLLGSLQYTEERDRLFDYASFQSGITNICLYTLELSHLAYEDHTSFHNLNVGILEDFSRLDALQDYCAQHDIEFNEHVYPRDEDLLEALSTGEVDLVLAYELIDRSDLRSVATLGPSPFYFCVTKGNATLLAELNRALNDLRIKNPYFEQNLRALYFGTSNQAISLSLAEQAFVRDSGPLRVTANADNPPYFVYHEDSQQFTGILVDYIDYVSEKTGLTFELIPSRSTAQSQAMLKTREVDIIAFQIHDYTVAEHEGLNLSLVYLSSPMVLIRAEGVTASTGLRVSYPTWAASPPLAQRLNQASEVFYFDNVELSLRAVANGTCEATYVSNHAANMLLESPQYRMFSQTVLEGVNLELCFATRNRDGNMLTNVLDKAILATSPADINSMVLANTSTSSFISVSDFIHRMSDGTAIALMVIVITIVGFLLAALLFAMSSNLRVRKLLSEDSLTGLPSEKAFYEKARVLIDREQEAQYALISIDIKRFKFVNETYGYFEGDQLLCATADMLRSIVGPGEIACRSYADHFMMLLRYTSLADLFDRVYCTPLGHDTEYHNRSVGYHVGLSSGIYLMENKAETLRVCSLNAQCARDQAKIHYGNSIVTYQSSIKEDIARERELENTMHAALRCGEFQPYYQAKTNIYTGEIVGAEALCRWLHPVRGVVSPMEFIPFFEKCGFIIQLDLNMFEQVCAQIATWNAQGFAVPIISCNFSRLHCYNDNFPDEVLEIAKRHHVDPSMLEIEITESVSMAIEEGIAGLFAQLRRYGFKIAVDDFGTGYSSLAVLDQLEIDVLKFDRSFFTAGIEDTQRKCVLRHMVELAQDLNIIVVCEGIETDEQVALLREVGCSIAQGYRYYHPEPTDEFSTHLPQAVSL